MLQDVRVGVRMLLKHKSLAAMAVLTLALAIGATTALFSLIEGVFLRPLPYVEADRLVVLWASRLAKGENQLPVSYPDWLSWSEQQRTFEGIGVFRNRPGSLQGRDEPIQAECFETSANFFSLLKASPDLGRTFVPEDADRRSQPVAVLSHGLWQRAFGGNPQIVGRTIAFSDVTYQIVGVMPAAFVSPAISSAPGLSLAPADAVWVPFQPKPVHLFRGNRGLRAIARLKPQRSLAAAQAEVTSIAASLGEQYRDSNRGIGVDVVPLHEALVGGTRQTLLVLFGAVGFVLLVACGNVANLTLARVSGRQRELGIRVALGAGRGRLIRQLLTEALVLASFGGAAGLALAAWPILLLRSLSLPELPRLATLEINPKVLGFAAGLSLLTGLLVGLAPALRASRVDVQEGLKGRQATAGRRGHRYRHALIGAEVAISLVLLIGAGLLLKSFWLLQMSHGIESPESILTLQFNLAGSAHDQGPRNLAFYGQMLERVRQIPGVRAAAVTTSLLHTGDPSSTTFEIEGRAPLAETEKPLASYAMVSSEYFPLAGIRLKTGRSFANGDRFDTPGVVLVNEALARLVFADEEPVGKRVTVNALGTEPRQIVGLVTDSSPYGVGVRSRPCIYYPYSQGPSTRAILMVRTRGPGGELLPAVRLALRELDPSLPISAVRTTRDILDEATVKPRWSTLVMTLFASVALALAAVGIFGVVSHVVAQRAQEIGIRMALGARPGHVLGLVVGQTSGALVGGVVCGAGLALALTRVLSGLLFGIAASDPATLISSVGLLSIVAACSAYLPARKAARADPAMALRRD